MSRMQLCESSQSKEDPVEDVPTTPIFPDGHRIVYVLICMLRRQFTHAAAWVAFVATGPRPLPSRKPCEKAMREQEEGQGGCPSRPRRRFASSPASGRFARTFSASSGSVSHTRTNQVPGAGSSTPSVRTPPRAKLKGISEASSGGARDYARMHCTVMHCHRWLWSRASFAFWRGGSPRNFVPLIDLCRCDFGCRLRRAKGRREWSYHIMVGP